MQPEKAAEADTVFRDPFVMRLPIDNEHFYEQRLDRVPFVASNDVYLFTGEDFGINVVISKDGIASIRCDKNPFRGGH